MSLGIELKHFAHLYLVIFIYNFLEIVTVYNWKLTCVLVRQTFFSLSLGFFGFVLFRELLVECGFFLDGCVLISGPDFHQYNMS